MPSDQQTQSSLELASLFVALARTLGENDETFLQRFDDNVTKVYRHLENREDMQPPELEALLQVHRLINEMP